MSTLQGESFYFHHGWHFLRADAFPMAKAVDAHRDAEGHAFYEANYRETGWQPVTLPHTFNDEDLFRDRIQDGGSGQRHTDGIRHKHYCEHNGQCCERNP